MTTIQAVAFSLMGGTGLTCNYYQMPATGGAYASNIAAAISQGVLTDNGVIGWADVDRTLVSMFTKRFATGEFDSLTGRNMSGEYGTYTVAKRVDTDSNVSHLLEVSRKGIVLLKNEDNILPLKLNETKSIAVIGKFLDRTE